MGLKKEIGQDEPTLAADTRFDQQNEMFKRSLWDEEMKPYARKFYGEAKYGDQAGFRQLDQAFRIGAWNIETSAGFGPRENTACA